MKLIKLSLKISLLIFFLSPFSVATAEEQLLPDTTQEVNTTRGKLLLSLTNHSKHVKNSYQISVVMYGMTTL
jgi:hypothetical protein